MTTHQEYEQLELKIKKDTLFVLSYSLGLRTEFGMDFSNSMIESMRVLTKMNSGFVEPYKDNVTKYQRLVEAKYPELDYLKIKFTGESITEGNTTIYPFEIK